MVTKLIPFEETLLKRVNRREAAEVERKKGMFLTTEQIQDIQKATFDATSQYLHGPQVAGYGGLLNWPGQDPRVITTIQGPLGIADLLPVIPAVDALPLFSMLTQFTDDGGSEATDLATRSKITGDLKAFKHTAPFGRIMRSTDTISPDKFGRVTNRAEPMDLELMNQTAGSSPWVPEAARRLDILSEYRAMWWKLGLSIRRKMEILTFRGAGTNVGTNNGYIEFYGLDTLVNTGKIDALTGNAVPAADSKIIAWNTLFDSSATIENESMDIVELMSRVQYYLMHKADGTEMNPMTIVIAMRRDLFIKLVNFWPYSYLTMGPAATTSKTVNLDAGDMTAMRDMMRSRQFLRINGVDIPVVFSDGILETATGLGVKSDIYWLTLSAGGMRTLYYEYFDYSNAQVGEIIARLPNNEWEVTDGGKYLWTFDRTYFVANFQALVEPRLVLRTAFLCARITGVNYRTALHLSDSIPGTIYEQPGGGSTAGGYGGGFYTSAV